MNSMASGYLRLKGSFFDESKLLKNKHQLSQEERVSYPTVHKYLSGRHNSDISTISGDVLYAILVKGMGYSIEEVKDFKVGDLFELVEEVA